MKVLLDECVPQDFRHSIAGHDVYTVGFMKWAGVKNGALLALAAADGFEVFVTTDRGFQHQQNPSALPVSVVILLSASNDVNDLNLLVPDLLAVLRCLPARTVTTVGPL